jgi:FAD/FMN-containing dehydrogenase
MIDLSLMKNVDVDTGAGTATVQPGVTLGELDAATQAHGLAVPTGINSTTGIAGLTVGGGFGWISRTHGMTIDNLISAEVVTADGKVLTASEKENADLFWGIRGGGGNLGIVTSFQFKAHKVGPEVLAGLIVHPGDQAATLLRQYRDLAAKAPDELTVWVVLRKAPPLPFLPEEWHGKDVVILAMLYVGDMKTGEEAAKPFRAMGKPIADVVGPHPFTGFQAAFDPLLTPGLRNYWKSHNFAALSDDAIDTALKYVAKLPSGHSEVFIAQMGGATSRVAPDATAYSHRDAQFVMNVHTRWEAAADDDRCIAWARGLFNDMRPFATGGVYVNFMPDDESDRISEAYGKNYDKLVAIKQKYDPDNLFRLNQNIRPAAAATG